MILSIIIPKKSITSSTKIMKPICKRSHCGLFAFLIFCNFHCFESEKQILLRLSKIIGQVKQEEVNLDGAKQEITKLLIETNQGYSTLTAKANSKRIIKSNLAGQHLFWIQSGRLYYFKDGNKAYFDIGVNKKIVQLNPSWNGHYTVILVKGEKGCSAKIASIREKRLFSYQLPSLSEKGCNDTPVVTDDGTTYFYVKNRELKKLSLKSGKFKERKIYKFSLKNIKYKKINNRFVLHQVGHRNIAIFWGNAGYYRLYYYNGVTGKIKLHPKVFSSYRLYTVRKNWKSKDKAGEPKQISSAKKRNAKKRKLGFYNASAYAYSGGAGKLRLHSLRFGDKLSVRTGFKTEMMTDLVFLKEQGAFLILKEERLYYWDPIDNNKQRLPLSAKKIYLFKDGLAYVDLFNRLYFRSTPFSDFEISLIDLYYKIARIKK